MYAQPHHYGMLQPGFWGAEPFRRTANPRAKKLTLLQPMTQTLLRRCAFCAFSFLDPFPRLEKCGNLACKAGQKLFLFALLCPGVLRMRTHAVLGKAHPEALAGMLSSVIRPLSPLQSALTQKRACKSFGIRTYKSLDLKSPGMNSYKKYRGVGCLRALQTLDLVHIFYCEGRGAHKPLDLKSPAMNSCKNHPREEALSCLPWALPSASQRRVSRSAQTSIKTGKRYSAIMVRYEVLRKDVCSNEPRS